MNSLCERTFGAASELESNYNGPFFFFFLQQAFYWTSHSFYVERSHIRSSLKS